MGGRVPGHMYFEASMHARTADDAFEISHSQHPLCPIVSLHPRYACDFLKPASPLEVCSHRGASLFYGRA